MEKSALVIFAREPEEGKVKTRLLKGLAAKTVTRLYKAFLFDVTGVCLKVRCHRRFIFYTSANGIRFLRKFRTNFILKAQRGRDLGVRINRAFTFCGKQGFKRMVIIGTDCLTLKASHLKTAFKQLSTHDAVIGPVHDGGYYLIGLREADATLFSGVHWSTSTVYLETVKRLQKGGKAVYNLPRLYDIDDFQALKKFAKTIENKPAAPYTKKILKKIF